MIDELELVRAGRPDVSPPPAQARRNAERALQEAIVVDTARAPRRAGPHLRLGLSRLAPVLALLVAVAVLLVFLGGHTRRPTTSAAPSGPQLVFTARPAGPARALKVGVVARAASILQQLISTLPGDRGQVAVTSAGMSLAVHLGRDSRLGRPELLSLVGMAGRLVFYDWEANVLTPSGQTVASRLATQDQNALRISQGGGTSGPGSPGAGSLALYAAVRLASRQPALMSADNGRPGPEYFAFSAPGSPACVISARFYRTREVRGAPCYLAGPTSTATQTLDSLPPGVAADKADVVAVPPGTVVLQAVPAHFAPTPSGIDPSAQFYVLRDHAALFGNAITKPAPTTDASGADAVAVGFTAKGAASFQRMTAQVAHRGDLVSAVGQTFDQHFAAALGDQLLSVPSIDFKTYPDGVPGANGADLTGGYTRRSVQIASQEMRLGALPITLQLSSSSTAG